MLSTRMQITSISQTNCNQVILLSVIQPFNLAGTFCSLMYYSSFLILRFVSFRSFTSPAGFVGYGCVLRELRSFEVCDSLSSCDFCLSGLYQSIMCPLMFL